MKVLVKIVLMLIAAFVLVFGFVAVINMIGNPDIKVNDIVFGAGTCVIIVVVLMAIIVVIDKSEKKK